jgi:hypothetical protein
MARPTAARAKSEKPKLTDAQKKAQKRNRRYHQENRERNLQRMRDRHAALSPYERALKDIRLRARPSMPAAGTVRAKDARNIAIARAYCEWSDTEEVIRIYIAASIMCDITGEKYVVDHVVPVNHPLVCGLHTHTNFQVITERENTMKSNLFWPQMPELTWASAKALGAA